MQTIVYDGSFRQFLCAVFDVYEYKFTDADICTEARLQSNMFGQVHRVHDDPEKSRRVWWGLQKKLMQESLDKVYRTFLSELPGIEQVLLRYMQYAFSSERPMEADYSHPAVIEVVQTAKKVWREKHRMEAFVRFSKTGDGIFFSIIEPDYNVLPLIAPHFETRYADQRWMIYDARRKYGIYFDGKSVTEVQVNFSEGVRPGEGDIVYDERELMYQQLWQQYFSSVNIASRKNKKLHLQHMPTRYWKYLTEKKGSL
jgi:probable DNA metabolism protein